MGYQVLRRSGNSELRIPKKMMTVNDPMATEWYLTKTPFDEDRTKCMIRSYANHQEAAVPEDMTGIESEHLRRTTEDGESRVESTHAMIMAAGEDGDDRSFEIQVACIITYERRCVYVRCRGGSYTHSLKEIVHRTLQKRYFQSISQELESEDVKCQSFPIILYSPIPMIYFRSYHTRRSWQLRPVVNKPHCSILNNITATSEQL